MTPTRASNLGLVFLLVWVTACTSETLAPGTLVQSFELWSVGGRLVPAIYDSSAYGYSTAVRGSFRFGGDGHVLWTWEEHAVFRLTVEELFRESTYTYQTTLPYSIHGTELKIGDDCPPDSAANCAAPMTGRIGGTKLILNPAFGRATDWIFVRVDP